MLILGGQPALAQNAARISGSMPASVPPASTASADAGGSAPPPRRPACEPVAQADTVA